jgi:hypothetical protein
VGAAKTGSTSLAAMFSHNYRVAHEPQVRKTTQLVIDWLEGRIQRDELQQKLLARDRQLKLELESAHPLGYISGVLADTFPRAKFIVTLREPYSWLESRLNYHHQVSPPAWENYRNYFWIQRNTEYLRQEEILDQLGLCSLDTYLNQYADHYQRVLSEIPKERFLLIKTSEINNSIPFLADYLGVNPQKIRTSHSKQSSNKIQPLKKMEQEFVRSKIWEHCQEIIVNYFPDQINHYQ